MADLVLLLFIGGMALAGWRSGFVRRLIGLAFLLVSFLAGAYLRVPAGAIVNAVLPKIPPSYAEMVGYSVAFGVLLVVLNLIAGRIERRLPQHGLSRAADAGLGAVLGFAEAVLIASAAIVILHSFSSSGSFAAASETALVRSITAQVDDSTIGGALEKTTVPLVLVVLGPLLPTAIKDVVPKTIPGGMPFFQDGFPKP